MALSQLQKETLDRVRRILTEVGLDNVVLPSSPNDNPVPPLYPDDSHPQHTPDDVLRAHLVYEAPAARPFSREELDQSLHRINRQLKLTSIVQHPLGAIVEYPQTGTQPSEAVGHLFPVDPEGPHPKGDFQYSLGDTHSSRRNVECPWLRNEDQTMANCTHLRICCRGLKTCSAGSSEVDELPCSHSFLRSRRDVEREGMKEPNLEAEEELFMKTLAFYCALMETGCDVKSCAENDLIDADQLGDDDGSPPAAPATPSRSRKRRAACSGQLVLSSNQYGYPVIQCEDFDQKNDRSHLIIRDLHEYNIDYLKSLLAGDDQEIARFEGEAKTKGYGPLVPCHFRASCAEQKQLCLYWHRNPDGKLERGTLRNLPGTCPVVYDIYTPDDLKSCPNVFIVSRNPHSHPPPLPTKTPDAILSIFHSLLLDLGWRLADASPRRVMLDSGFMEGLRRCLGWTASVNPTLSQLHPSLGNFDRVRRCISTLRKEFFPGGTGFEGARLIQEEHTKLPRDQRYVRAVESHPLPDGGTFNLVVCMSSAMSSHLMQSRRVTIDTSFKRVHGFEEFEIETWDTSNMKSFVSARAFVTSQSGDAHLILFKRIFAIAEEDTGQEIKFRHIHGSGFEIWVADAHKGQALGLGKYCQFLCRDKTELCVDGPAQRLCDLDPYDHLKRCYKACVVHFKRNISDLRSHVTQDVQNAMLSLSSAEPHSDLEGVFRLINAGGKRASAWLKDKREGSRFMLPALYHPHSHIPLEVWKSAPTSTNGNEQAHRNINRDGVNMTLLAGIMRGMQYDARALASLNLYTTTGIASRDQASTHYRRIATALYRKVHVQRRIVAKREESRSQADLPPSAASASASISSHSPPVPNLYTTLPLSEVLGNLSRTR